MASIPDAAVFNAMMAMMSETETVEC